MFGLLLISSERSCMNRCLETLTLNSMSTTISRRVLIGLKNFLTQLKIVSVTFNTEVINFTCEEVAILL